MAVTRWVSSLYFLHGKADAVVGNALIDLEFGGEGGLDPECFIGSFGFGGLDFSKCFDDTGEHGSKFVKNGESLRVLGKISYFCFPKIILNMLIIDSKDCENIDKALKKYKKKFEKAKVLVQLRERQSFTKPSVKRRGEVLKAVYKQQVASGKFEE